MLEDTLIPTLLEDKDDPTQYIIDSFNSKKEIEGTIINIKDFGIFVEIQNSYDVLIPISECSWNKISKNDIQENPEPILFSCYSLLITR